MSPKPIMLPISRGILEHKDRMGPAIWEFLWFVDKVTEDVPDGAGKFHGVVLGGHPVSLAQIAGDLKEHVDTAKRNVKALESSGYIVRRRLPENRCAYAVANSIKWLRRDRREGENAPTHEGINAPADVDVRAEMHPAQVQECTHREGINAPANKETLQDLTKDLTKSKRTKLVSLPKGFTISERVRAWASKNEFDQLDRHLEHFIGKSTAKGYAYADWDQALMNAIRDNWANLDRRPPDVTVKREPESTAVCPNCDGKKYRRQYSPIDGWQELACLVCNPEGAIPPNGSDRSHDPRKPAQVNSASP